MTRKKNPNRDKALSIYKKHKGNIKLSEIANILDENPSNIRSWKRIDCWDEKIPKPGAPKGNKNALGNKGNRNARGAPQGNINAVRHGLYMNNDRYIENMKEILPKSLLNTMKKLNGETPLDILYRNIMILDAKIINSHNILNVKNNVDHTILRRKVYTDKNMEDIEEFEIQTAQDKESSYGNTVSKMKKTLNDMIKTYLELSFRAEDRSLSIEERIARIEVLKSKVANDEKSKEDKIDELFNKLEECISDVK